MLMNSKVYDILKWVALTVLPALITLYGVIGATCNIPYTQQVLTIATAFDAFLGTILGVSSNAYSRQKKLEEEALNGGEEE